MIGVTNGWQALALLLKSPIRLVLGGDALCGADGIELAQRIKEIKPDTSVVVCSRNLLNSMKSIDAYISAEESSSNLLTVMKTFLEKS